MIRRDPLFRHSAWLIGATCFGHAGNYVYHFVAGRMLPDAEYGLLMALFGAVNVLVLPMSALGVALGRSIAARPSRARETLRPWILAMLPLTLVSLGLVAVLQPWLQSHLQVSRRAPLFLAATIPLLNLTLVLYGAGLQGRQRFDALAIRGALLFGIRALLVGGCLILGFRAAGWALLAHLMGMLAALIFSQIALSRGTHPSPHQQLQESHVGHDTLRALPVLASFAVLMTADVLLVRRFLPPETAGLYAQAATLGRMILWLPLPIASAMFPKVVRGERGSSEHRNTALRAVAYSLVLVIPALAGAWILAPLGLRLLYGANPGVEQIRWLRHIALAMLPLAPLHVWIHYELARGSVRRLWPILCAAVLFLTLSTLHPTVDHLLGSLQASTSLALIGSAAVLFVSRKRPQPDG